MSDSKHAADMALLSTDRLAEIRADDARFENGAPAQDAQIIAAHRHVLIAHVDALQKSATANGDEALGMALWQKIARWIPVGSPALRVALTDAARDIRAIGLAAGRSEGEAERGQLQAIIDGEREGYQELIVKRDAEIAHLTTERDALAKQLDLGPAEVVTLAAWGEEKAKSASLTAELAEARAAAATERLLCQAATDHVRDREAMITRLREQVAERDATIARRTAELASWREVTGADTPHQLSAELAIARAKRRRGASRP